MSAPMHPAPRVWVFQRAALGDSVLLWPLLRALLRTHRVTFVTDRSKGRLASDMLGILSEDAEQPRFDALWIDDDTRRTPPIQDVERVLSFLESSDRSPVWPRNAGAMFPSATIERVTGTLDRNLAMHLAWREGGDPPNDIPAAAIAPAAAIVLHAGAGARIKWWPVERWAMLADILRADGADRVDLIAGEVEAERFTPVERRIFKSVGGRFLFELSELGDTIRSARVFIAADTGSSHLAGALGVSTVTLFGPTDPALWAPIGPRVRVVVAPDGRMADLEVHEVLAAAQESRRGTVS